MDEQLPRNINDLVAGALAHFPVVHLQGVRRSGKSTLAQTLAAAVPSVYVSMDDDETKLIAQRDPSQLMRPARAGKLMVIDEVQRVPSLILNVKAEVDRDKRPGSFILTGSSDYLKLPDVPDSLAGRAVSIQLRPLSQGELAKRKEDFATTLLQQLETAGNVTSSWSRADYLAAAWRGGYPEAMALESPWRNMWFDSYVERMTSRDAQGISERISAERVRAVLRLVAANQSGELVKARIAQDLEISPKSVTTCLDTLQALFLIDAIPPWTANLTKREVGRHKVITADPSLALHLTGISQAKLTSDEGGHWAGHTIEGFVLTELLKQQQWSSTRWTLSHYRDTTGVEVDAVIELEDGRVILIEVKSSSSYRSDHFSNIQKLADRIGDRLAAGVVLGTSDHSIHYSDKTIGLPISSLWEPW